MTPLQELAKLTSGFTVWHAGNSIKVSITVATKPPAGATDDGFDGKDFNASTVGQGDRDCFTPLIKRAVKWARTHREENLR